MLRCPHGPPESVQHVLDPFRRQQPITPVQQAIRVGLEPAELPGIEPGQPNALEVSLA